MAKDWPWTDKSYSLTSIVEGLERMADRHDRRLVWKYRGASMPSTERLPSKPSRHWARKLGESE